MAIEFPCGCGQMLRAEEAAAGMTMRCPACGAELAVPHSSVSTPPVEPDRPHAEDRIIRAEPITRRRRRESDWEDEELEQRERGPQRTSGKAVIAFVLAFCAFGCGLLAAVPSFIFAGLSLSEIGQSRGRVGGRSLAIASIVMSAFGIFVGPALLIALLFPAVAKIRDAAARIQSANNLRQLGLAMQEYNDTHGRLPPAVVYGQDGKPLYSWRVLLLPFLEDEQLYGQFKLDEPWDGPSNKFLIGRVPQVFELQHHEGEVPGMTHYLAFNGGGAAFDTIAGDPRPLPLENPLRRGDAIRSVFERGPTMSIPQSFPDGIHSTFLIVEAADPVVWSSPQNLQYDPARPLPRLGGVSSRNSFQALFADASVREIPLSTDEGVLRAFITAAGGEPIPAGAP